MKRASHANVRAQRAPKLSWLALAFLVASLSVSGCGGTGGTSPVPPVPSATVAPDAGCFEGWPYLKRIEGPLASTVTACENEARSAVRFRNNGEAMVGLQVAEGTPTFGDPEEITTGELTAYEAVLSVVPHTEGNEESGRVHVLLPGKTVEVQTNSSPYRITLTSDTEEVVAGYAAQSFTHWAYGKVLPSAALISELGHCATGIGRVYASYGTTTVELGAIIKEDFPRLSPCVSAMRRLTTLEQSGTAQPQQNGADAGGESVPSIDDQPRTPLFKPVIPVLSEAAPIVDEEAATLADDAASGSTLETVLGDIVDVGSKFR
jgi:hypothetical protein